MMSMKFFIGIFAVAAVSFCHAGLVAECHGRKAFIRGEKNASIQVEVRNTSKKNISALRVNGTFAGKSFELKYKTGGSRTAKVDIPLETRLVPGWYPLTFTVSDDSGNKIAKSVKIGIAARRHDKMPVLMIGAVKDARLREIGFTGQMGIREYHSTPSEIFLFDRDKIPSSDEIRKKITELADDLDNYLMENYETLDHFTVELSRLRHRFMRVNHEGVKLSRIMDAADPEVVRQLKETARRVKKEFPVHPAVTGVRFNTEMRDAVVPSFTGWEQKAYKAFAGVDVPREAKENLPPHYSQIAGFPVSRVVPEDHPLLKYYRWFWKQGDGWNPLNSALSDIFRKDALPGFFTAFGPCLRVPPLWGSGGTTDIVYHWTYPYPDPINIGVNNAQIRAMARGNDQQIMNMTQLIAYRNRTAPIGQKTEKTPQWVKEYPVAPYISVAPDLLEIAVWTQVSRQTQGMLFHGFASLVPYEKAMKKRHKGYQYTNPEMQHRLKYLLQNVVKPYGPLLKRIPERPAKIAILESYSSAFFAGRGTWGAAGWIWDTHLMMLWANLAPAVVYEETLVRDGFGDIEVLVMPHCDVLTEKAYKAIRKFRKNGGIIVADRYLVPALTPDIVIDEFIRTRDPRKDKAQLQKAGLKLKKDLRPFFTPYTETGDPDLVTWVRSSGDADYLFAVNDKRTFGDYWGMYGKVMEKSVPHSGKVTVGRKAGAVYDLLKKKIVAFSSDGKKTVIPLEFKDSTGKMLLILPEELGKAVIKAGAKVRRGEELAAEWKIVYRSGKKVAGLLPVSVEVFDSKGAKTDDSAFTVAENGKCTVKIAVPLNGAKGNWRIRFTDMVSGGSVEKIFKVED